MLALPAFLPPASCVFFFLSPKIRWKGPWASSPRSLLVYSEFCKSAVFNFAFLISLDSQAVIADKTMYVAGQLGLDPQVTLLKFSFVNLSLEIQDRKHPFQRQSQESRHLVRWGREGLFLVPGTFRTTLQELYCKNV